MSAIVKPEVEQLAGALDAGDRASGESGQWRVYDRGRDATAPHPLDAEGHAAVELILDCFDFGQFGHGGFLM